MVCGHVGVNGARWHLRNGIRQLRHFQELQREHPDSSNLPLAMSAISKFLATCLLLLAGNALAGGPPQEVGKFTRSDGFVVTAYEQDVGSIGHIGVDCYFDLPGRRYMAPPYHPGNLSCVVRAKDSIAEIYWYPSDRFPIGSRVERFDGYDFIDITTPARRLLSPFIHTSDHLVTYLVALALFAPCIALGIIILKATSWVGWQRVWRIFWIVVGVFITLFYTLICAWAGPASPPVFFILLSLALLVYWQTRKYAQRRRRMQEQ
jgi:hypothetical protein